MKTPIPLLLLPLTLLFAATSPASAGTTLLSLKSAQVLRPLQLRRIDGRLAKLVPDSDTPPDLSGLPRPKGADASLCGDFDSKQRERLLRQTQRLLDLSKLARALEDEGRRTLTREETALVETSPRCEPFLPFLGNIAEILSPRQREKTYEVSQLSLKGGFLQSPVLELLLDDWVLDSGSRAQLSMGRLRGWGPGYVPANATGQNLAVTIEDLGEDYEPPIEGGENDGWERCTTPDGRPGRRHYTYDPVYHHRYWRLTFTDAAGRRVMELMATTQRTEDNGSHGECWPLRREGGRR